MTTLEIFRWTVALRLSGIPRVTSPAPVRIAAKTGQGSGAEHPLRSG